MTDFWNWITKDSISFFTFVLAVVAIGQGFLILWQVRLGRQEFVANQRPKLRVRNIVVKTPHRNTIDRPPIFQDGELVSGQLYVSNIGGTAAMMVEQYILVYWSDNELPMERPYEGKSGVVFTSPPRIEAGSSLPIPFQSETPIPSKYIANSICSGASGWKLWVMGWVQFRDDSNLMHRTAFCRRFDTGLGRIVRREDEDYDHEE